MPYVYSIFKREIFIEITVQQIDLKNELFKDLLKIISVFLNIFKNSRHLEQLKFLLK